MFTHSKPRKKIEGENVLQRENVDVESLSYAYKCFNGADWDYGIEAGEGGDLVRECITKHNKLKTVLHKIASSMESEAAIDASLLFDRLYKKGFSKGLLREQIRNSFVGIFSAEDLDALNNNKKTMTDCLNEMALNLQDQLETRYAGRASRTRY